MPAFPSQSLSAVGNLMETSALDETVRYAISTRHYLAYASPRVKGAWLHLTPMGSPLKANTQWCVGALTRGGDHLRPGTGNLFA
jgi:hypothetical protein